MSRLLLGVLLVAIILTCVACQEHVEKEGWDGVGFFLGEKSASQLQMTKRRSEILSILNKPPQPSNKITSTNQSIRDVIANAQLPTSSTIKFPNNRFPSCTKQHCKKFCRHGFQTDARGCPMCACKQPCPTYRACKRKCEFGYVLDTNGCNSKCQCKEAPALVKPKPICPQYLCRRHCQFGFKINEKGCRTCSCNEKPIKPKPLSICPLYRCRRHCQFGFKINEKGCRTCSCNEKPIKPSSICPLYGCRRYCPYGFKINEKGCTTCSCNETPNTTKPFPIKPICPQYLCRRHCQFGFKINEKGCRTCSCNEKPNTTKPFPIKPNPIKPDFIRRFIQNQTKPLKLNNGQKIETLFTKPAVLRAESAPVRTFPRRGGRR